MKENPPALQDCAHCQQPIAEPVYGAEEKVYCCTGCQMVDEMMNASGKRYAEEALPLRRYAYLDEPRVRAKVLDFQEGGQARLTLHLPAIHCSSCIYLLENLSEVEPALLQVEVHFGRKEAVLVYQTEAIALSKVAALLDFIGYPPDFQTRLGGPDKTRHTLLIRLGVAGFFFGNTMLLALPEYLHSSLAQDPALQSFFRYLMLFFSLPVLLYSAQPYFKQAFKALRAGFLSIDVPIVLGILVLFGRSTYEVLAGVGAGYFDSLAGLVFFLLIGKWYQQKTYANFSFDRQLDAFLPLAAYRVLPDGREQATAVEDLQKNDRIRLREGEVLPADADLHHGQATLDYSYLTGESLPVTKRAGQAVFAGARLTGAAADFILSAPVDQSYLARLWAQEGAGPTKPQGQRSLSDRISRFFTPAILLLALLGGMLWWPQGAGTALQVVTAVLIVACPCALALAEPFAHGSLVRALGRYGFYLKNHQVLPALTRLSHLVFDKTGTLTRTDHMEVSWAGKPLSPEEQEAVALLAQKGHHPLLPPLVRYLHPASAQLPPQPLENFTEHRGQGITARVGRFHLRLGSARYLGQEAPAATHVALAIDGVYRGYFRFQQELRPELPQVLAPLRKRYALSLLSGDHPAEQERFQALLGPAAELRFQQSPHEKLAYLEKAQAQGHQVMMLGDGLNDAGALQQSDVGVSLCEEHVNYFPASDAVLRAGALPGLPAMLALAQYGQQVIKAAFGLSFLYNLVGLSLALAGVVSPLVAAVLMPLSSITVVLFVTLLIRRRARRRLAFLGV
ncbi:MAG: HAD-IC family P-type ATPase [Schleiferiaceae bacterium]|nr:HAD-IC family P-type ATPase [Schleiferiaceae bacterium]MDR9442151.1 HAD-IC family P-type ATPase [Schleiferiaceae bacterium]